MSRGLLSRLLRGAGALAYNRLIGFGTRILLVPLFLLAWGVEQYGEWVSLTAMATLLNLSNFGFISATLNDMTMKHGAGRIEEAVASFQSTLLLFGLVVLPFLGLFLALPALVDYRSLFDIIHLSASEAFTVLACMAVMVVLRILTSLLGAGLQAVGRFALREFTIATVLLVQTLALAGLLLLGGEPPLLAAVMAAVDGLGAGVMLLLARRFSPWMRLGVGAARREVMGTLLRPSLAFIALNLGGTLLAIQVPILMVGSLMGSGAVAVFSVTGTLVRTVQQIASLINMPLRPELARAWGSGDLALARLLFYRANQVTLVLAAAAGVGLITLGRWITELWTAGRLVPDQDLVIAFTLMILAGLLWRAASNVLVASNRHERVALAFLLLLLLALGVAWLWALPLWGLTGIAGALAGVEAVMVVLVLIWAARQLGDSPATFLAALVTPKRRRPPPAASGPVVSGLDASGPVVSGLDASGSAASGLDASVPASAPSPAPASVAPSPPPQPREEP